MPLAPTDFARRVINRARVSKPSRVRGPAPLPLWQRVQALTGYAAETCRAWCEACGFEPGETWAKGTNDGD